jgi:hypothetical protein
MWVGRDREGWYLARRPESQVEMGRADVEPHRHRMALLYGAPRSMA